METLLSPRLQLSALALSVLYLAFLVHLIRREILQLKYSMFWFFFGLAFLAFSLYPPLVVHLGHLIGVKWPENALFLLAIFSILALLIQISAGLSSSLDRERRLAQETALLRHELDLIKKSLEKLQEGKK
jgi:hypothetical protein